MNENLSPVSREGPGVSAADHNQLLSRCGFEDLVEGRRVSWGGMEQFGGEEAPMQKRAGDPLPRSRACC